MKCEANASLGCNMSFVRKESFQLRAGNCFVLFCPTELLFPLSARDLSVQRHQYQLLFLYEQRNKERYASVNTKHKLQAELSKSLFRKQF